MGPRPRGRGMENRYALPSSPYIASMGPRPRGRGMPAHFLGAEREQALQWGRARAGAEWEQFPRKPLHHGDASMGPRPRGRGMNPVAPCACRRKPSFNGAAPARARNGNYRSRCWPSALASMGPRPRGRGMTKVVCFILSDFFVLQWGRARAGAE